MSTLPAVRVWESHLVLMRRIWKTDILLNLLQPILFILGMGLGVGSLVDRRAGSVAALGDVPYLAFLAPGLMATTAMMIGAFEALWPLLGGFKWGGSFEAMAATELTPRQVVLGEMLWWTTRCGISVIGVAIVLLVIPDTRSWGVVWAIPVATACGVAFAVLVGTWTSTREFDGSFSNITRLVITPLFLFGGAFYPVSSLPDVLEPIAYVTPLWHAVELCRDLSLHRAGWAESLLHIGVLAAFITVGWRICQRTFTRRLHR